MLGTMATVTAGVALGAGTASAAAATTTTLHQADIATACSTAPTKGFCTDNTGPKNAATGGTAQVKGAANAGYLELSTPADGDAVQVLNVDQNAKNLSTITDLKYNSLVTQAATSNAGIAPAMRIPINPGTASNGTSAGFSTLVWEPIYTSTPSVPGTQESFDPFTAASGWHSTKAGLGLDGTGASFAAVKAALPNATIYGIGVGQGSGNAGLVDQVNQLTINDNIYKFASLPPTVSVTPPATLTTGAAATAFTGTATNPSASDIPNARYDIAFTGDAGLKADQLELKYKLPNGDFATVPLTGTTANGGAITGFFGPKAGFNFPAGATPTTNFTVAAKSGAPLGPLTSVVTLNSVATDGTLTALATSAPATTTIQPGTGDQPTLTVGTPATLTVGATPTTFTGTATNPSASDIKNARYDISFTGDAGLTADQIDLEYQVTGSTTFQKAPLTGTTANGGTITGYFGPQTGFTFPAGKTLTTNFKVSLAAGAPLGNLTSTVKLDTVSPTDGTFVSTLASTDAVTTAVVNPQYVSIAPKRVLDTRNGTGSITPTGRLKPNTSYTFTYNAADMPLNQQAYAFNVTASNPSGPGFLAVGPGNAGAPSTSLVNLNPGTDVANFAVIPNKGSNSLTIRVGDASADVIVDLVGYYPSAGSIDTFTPTRVVDTRNGTGSPATPVAANTTRSFQIGGQGGVANGAKAVAINVTASNPSGPGNLRIYPDGAAVPNASSINYIKGQDKAAFVIVNLPANGKIDVESDNASANIVIDTFADYPTTSNLVTASPTRVTTDAGVALSPGVPADVQITGKAGVPTDAQAVLVTVTAKHNADSTGPGNLTAYPAGATKPNASTLNYVDKDSDVANFAIVKLGTDGKISLDSEISSVNALVDVVGYIPAGS